MKKIRDMQLAESFGKLYKKIFKRCVPFFYIAVAVLVIAFVVTVSSSNLMQNVETRAVSDVNSTVSMQASAFKDYMDEQFQVLRLVADMLQNGRHFASEGIQPTLGSIVNTFRLCSLCFADTDGNVIDYQGNAIGSCADREYFTEIMDGSHTQICEYLSVTKNGDEPRVILSMPAYDESGEMLGVLFCSKEVSVLEDSLFEHNALFDTSSAVFVCDEDGQIIAANENGYNFFSKHNVAENAAPNISDLSNDLQSLREDSTARHIEINGIHCFAGYTDLDECGWGLYCLVDEADVNETYSDNQKRTKSTITAIVLIFIACIVYILILEHVYMRRKKREARIIQQYNDSYRNILSETHCAVVEYDTDTKTMTTIQENFGDLKLGSLNGTMDAYENYKHMHPEFDFEELESEIDIAKKNGKTCSFETMLAADPDRFYWLKTKLIPITDENGEMTRIYCVLFDVSDLHQAHETALDTYAQIPGAVHRHVLTDPIHVNYYSDGLCKMLGYTHAEIDELIGSEYLYSMLICEEDRQRFIDFLDELAKNGGVGSIEYHLQCKSGALIEVSDTMDAKRSSSGVMYGYSVVTDLRKYREEQQQLEQELKQTRDQLAQSRVKNAGSQMQPHFLYNALSSIREIVLEDPEYASDLIYDFTTHLRACVRSMSSDALIPFTQELENIRAYVNIEKMRFGERLSVEYNCPETDFDIIPLSIQPLVENAVRHGIFDRGAAGGKVTVSTARGDGCIFIYAEDNGVGFDYKKTMQEVEDGTRDSNGLANLIFRFATLMKAEVSVDSEIGIGTKVTVTIPESDAKRERERRWRHEGNPCRR
jgi:PAS domain-containing protein/anti-sigma regulatory factor (Ser/Thr protein kinase)